MFKVGQKVKVVDGKFRHLPSYTGKRGKVVGATTDFSCRVKLVGGDTLWFDNDELELDS